MPIVQGLPQCAHAEKQTAKTVHVRLLVIDVASVYFLVRQDREQKSVALHWRYGSMGKLFESKQTKYDPLVLHSATEQKRDVREP